MNPILDCQNLTKYYGNKIALDNLNLTLEPGKIIGLSRPQRQREKPLLSNRSTDF